MLLMTADDSNIDDFTLQSFQVPEFSAEYSIDDSLPTQAVATDISEVEYEIIAGSSSRQGDKLTDSQGYSYGVKQKNEKHTIWRCSVRNKQLYFVNVLDQRNQKNLTSILTKMLYPRLLLQGHHWKEVSPSAVCK